MSASTVTPFTLGGSEIPAVLGLDPYLSPYALACRKLGVTDDPPPSVAARMGNALEAAHLQLLADEGRDVIPYNGLALGHKDHPWLIGHLDAIEVVAGRSLPVELKLRGVTPSDALKIRDTIQAGIYAELADAPRALVSQLHGGYGGIVRDEWEVERDPELFGMIVERCEAFLLLLRRGKCPAPDGSDSARDAIRSRYAEANEHRKVRLTNEGYAALLRVRELDETIRAAKAQRERYAQRVQDEMGEAVEAISPADVLAARWKPVARRTVDTTRLKRDHPALASEYESVTTSRRFEVNV